MMKTLVVVAFLGLNFYIYHYLATNPVYPTRASFAEFPLQLADWSCAQREFMDAKVERNLGVTDYLLCNFVRPSDGAAAFVYVGYHASQVREEGGGAGENSIHPPAHCLPGSGWDIIDNKTVPLDFPGLPGDGATAKRLIVAKGNARQLTYYWYQSRGRVISQDWKKIIYVGLDRALRSRTDGSLVRLTAPIERKQEARTDQAIHDLAREIVPLLPRFVPN